ncbi:MAG: hypothetical protein HYV63_09320 [Candidatus Schekmanbacteria bacterium]|nr:hypothetical protein [Candidatus Schekmanbacteria bacterium]
MTDRNDDFEDWLPDASAGLKKTLSYGRPGVAPTTAARLPHAGRVTMKEVAERAALGRLRNVIMSRARDTEDYISRCVDDDIAAIEPMLRRLKPGSKDAEMLWKVLAASYDASANAPADKWWDRILFHRLVEELMVRRDGELLFATLDLLSRHHPDRLDKLITWILDPGAENLEDKAAILAEAEAARPMLRALGYPVP